MWFVAAVAAAAALYVLWTYWQLTALRGRDRSCCSVTRIALLAVALFAVLRPMLLLKVAVPQQNFVGVLLDDSRSMQVADEAGQAAQPVRARSIRHAGHAAAAALGERFVPRVFRFSQRGGAPAVDRGPDVPGHRHALQRRARSRIATR